MNNIYVIGNEIINLDNVVNMYYSKKLGGVEILSRNFNPDYYNGYDIFIACKEEEYIKLLDTIKLKSMRG